METSTASLVGDPIEYKQTTPPLHQRPKAGQLAIEHCCSARHLLQHCHGSCQSKHQTARKPKTHHWLAVNASCSAALGSMKGSNTKQRGHTTSGCAGVSQLIFGRSRGKTAIVETSMQCICCTGCEQCTCPNKGHLSQPLTIHHPLTSFGTTMRVNHELNTAATAPLRGPQHLSIQLTGPQQLHSRSSHTAAAVQPHRLW